MEKAKTDIWQHTMTYGAILGISITILAIIFYILDILKYNIFISIVIWLINLALTVIFVVIGTKNYRDKILGGYIDFGKAFLIGLLIVVFSSLITTLYNILLNTIIDPTYFERTMEAVKEWMGNFMYNKGISEEQIDQALEQIDSKEMPSVVSMIFSGIASSAIGGAILSLITAAILKKESFDSQ
jgi:hypothetical protein